MSDQNTQETTEQSEGSALRKKLEEALAENKELRQERRHRAYKDANLPEGSYDVFDSMYDGELTPDALTEFAKAKGFAVGQPATETTEQEQSTPTGEEALSQLNSGTIPPRDPSVDDRMKQAEAEGDWATFDRLAAEKLEAARRAS